MLLAKNAYVNSKTKAGWTPLHFVAFKGFNEMINPLVSKHNTAIDATSMVSIIILISDFTPNRVYLNIFGKPFSVKHSLMFGFTQN